MAPVDIKNVIGSDIVEEMETTIPLGEYLFKRLLSIGSKSVFGVPGDFNLPLLEYMYDDSGCEKGSGSELINWIGCCNELNAAYAADGYSRYTNKIGCLITTYGVGELSALNGVAGAMAEHVKILHIVGVAPTFITQNDSLNYKNLHHLLPNIDDPNKNKPNYQIYYEMIKDRISCSSAYLENLENACDQIDNVIRDIFKYSKPGYIFIPSDYSNKLVSNINLLNTPVIRLEDCIPSPPNFVLDEASNALLNLVYNSKQPGIIADVFVDRYGCNNLLNSFIELTQIWNFSTIMGKSILNESSQTYMGSYNGLGGLTSVYNKVLSCDLILIFGINTNEMNSGNYSFKYNKNATVIELNRTNLKITRNIDGQVTTFENISFVHVLRGMLSSIDSKNLNFEYSKSTKPYSSDELVLSVEEETSKISQNYLQKTIPSIFNESDIFVCETGSFQFAVPDFKFPKNLKYISQGFYLSIGMAIPATLGVGIAMKDYPKLHMYNSRCEKTDYVPRLILMEGDGAAQMTIQEMTTILRHKIPLEILLWNNSGYTVERAIEGQYRSYNDIMSWDWTKIFEVFGDPDHEYSRSTMVDSKSKLNIKLNELKKNLNRNCIELVEVKLDPFDVPRQLQYMVEELTFKKNNSESRT